MKRVGKTITRWPRTIVTWPSSSGWRSASSAGRANSDSSSRKSTPWWASVASPGCGERAAADEAGRRRSCGAARGTAARSTSPPPRVQAGDEWMRVTSIASSRVSGGRIDGSRRASIVLPVPGGPCRNRLWPPAAATSSAGIEPVVAADVARGPAARARGSRRRRLRRAAAARASPRRTSTASCERARRRAPRAPATSAASARPRARDAAAARSPCAARALGDRERAADRRAPRRSATARRRPRSPRARPARAGRAATSSATASGRSKPGPTLRRYAGARLTVMRSLRELEAGVRRSPRARARAPRGPPCRRARRR